MNERLAGPPRAVLLQGAETLYEIDLSVAPSPAWRAAFLRPPVWLAGIHAMPALGRVRLGGATAHFRTTPDRLDAWLHRIEGWIAYANSVVEE